MTAPRPLVLALVTDAVSPWHSGGKETRTHNYANHLSDLGFEVHVYTMNWWAGPAERQQGAVHLHAICRRWPLYVKERRSIWQAVAFSLACFRLLFARFDVAEVDQIPILPMLTMKIVCLIKRRPLVATWHEVWGKAYWRSYLGPAGVLAALAERLVLTLPDRVIAVSEGTAARVREMAGDTMPIHIGLNGIDLAQIDAAPPAEVPHDLLFAGRLLSHKGVDVLLRAAAELRAGGTSLSVAIVGRGPELESLRSLAADLGLQDVVSFLGELPTHDEVLGHMKSARLLVFPTRREGYGLAAVEAMACGTPVITTNHPDNFARLLVQPGVNGHLCAPDGSDLPDLIRRALAERADLSVGARREAEQHTWAGAVRRCAAAYSPVGHADPDVVG